MSRTPPAHRRPTPIVNAMTHRRRGLLPRQRLRRRRAAAAAGTRIESRVCATPSGCSRSSTSTGVRGDVLRARLGRRALSGAGPDDRRAAATRSRRTATRIGWSTTRRATAFRDDVRRAKALLEDAAAVRCSAIARRATRSRTRSLWALDVLIEEGYEYDASIFPIHHDRYGIPSSPRHPYRDRAAAAGSLVEVPGLDHGVGPVEPADRRRRLLPHPAVLRGRAGASPG